MARHQNGSEGGSNGSAHYEGNRPSGSRTTQSASSPKGYEYNPQEDPHYIRVDRLQREDYSHLEEVINHPALETGSISSYGPPHASPHGGDTGRDEFGNSLSAPHGSQTYSGEVRTVQNRANQSYVEGILHQAPGNDRNAPYHPTGFVRRDRQVFDNTELYEEYRPYGQVDRHGEYRRDK